MSTFEAQQELSAAPAPRTLSDLRSFLHGYRIKVGLNYALTNRASVIIEHIDWHIATPHSIRAARELAELDPSLSWLPGWKPRVAVAAKGLT